MHFAFTDEQAMIASTAKEFFAENATSERTRAAAEGDGFDRDTWTAFARHLGLAGVALPEDAGGAGLGLIELAIVAEAAGRHVAAIPFIPGSALAATAIAVGGTSEQQAEWLPRLISGEAIGSYVEVDGDGVGLAPYGVLASVFVVVSAGSVALATPGAGLAIEACTTMDGTRPLARVRVVRAALDPLADGATARGAAERAGWVAVAADALGGAQACLDRTVAFAGERVQFGRPIGSFQAVKHRLADMMVEVEQARSAVYWAACAADECAPDATLAAHAAKAFATDAYAMCAGNMIQLHGGIGFTWEHDAHLFFKRARADQSWLGTPAWHRERIAQVIGLDEAA